MADRRCFPRGTANPNRAASTSQGAAARRTVTPKPTISRYAPSPDYPAANKARACPPPRQVPYSRVVICRLSQGRRALGRRGGECLYYVSREHLPRVRLCRPCKPALVFGSRPSLSYPTSKPSQSPLRFITCMTAFLFQLRNFPFPSGSLGLATMSDALTSSLVRPSSRFLPRKK